MSRAVLKPYVGVVGRAHHDTIQIHRAHEHVERRATVRGLVEKVPMFDTRDLAAALVCLAERSPLHQR